MESQPGREPRDWEALRRWDPERIGPYVVIGRLGSGSMGQVYLGRSAAGRLVAVKTIRVELAEETGFRTRFAQEVAAARKVSGVLTAAVVEADPVAVPAGAGLRAAAGEHGALAGRRVRRGTGLDPRGRAGAPRPEAVQRAGRAGRAAGDRLRGGPGGRADGPHHRARRGRHPRVHGAGAGQGHP